MENLINQINELQNEYNKLYYTVGTITDPQAREVVKDRMREITALLTELNEELSELTINQ